MKVSIIVNFKVLIREIKLLSLTDINECLRVDLNICEDTCTNIPGSFSCGCGLGYSLAANLINCEGTQLVSIIVMFLQ